MYLFSVCHREVNISFLICTKHRAISATDYGLFSLFSFNKSKHCLLISPVCAWEVVDSVHNAYLDRRDCNVTFSSYMQRLLIAVRKPWSKKCAYLGLLLLRNEAVTSELLIILVRCSFNFISDKKLGPGKASLDYSDTLLLQARKERNLNKLHEVSTGSKEQYKREQARQKTLKTLETKQR